MEAEEYRRFSLEVWEAMAPGWERWRAFAPFTVGESYELPGVCLNAVAH